MRIIETNNYGRENNYAVDDYVERCVLSHDGDRIRLERQPEKVVKCVGRLLEMLLKKKLLTEDEFYEVIGLDDYDRNETKLVYDEVD